jgi:hypothetical protein
MSTAPWSITGVVEASVDEVAAVVVGGVVVDSCVSVMVGWLDGVEVCIVEGGRPKQGPAWLGD